MAKVRNTCLPFFQGTTPATKVRSILVSYFIHTWDRFLLKNEKKYILKKINSMKGLVCVQIFTSKDLGINIESHMYKVTN